MPNPDPSREAQVPTTAPTPAEVPGIEDVRAAAEAIRCQVRRTPLVEFPAGDPRMRLWLKLECLQVTGAFKARGASFHVSQLSAAERAAGVVAVSSGNHAKAVAWAARLAGVAATVCMPANAYPSKIEAARRFGAEVFLGADRDAAEARARELAAAGRTFVPPYDDPRTIAGQGTVGLEILEQRPSVDRILVPVGGGGLLAGISIVAKDRRDATADATAPSVIGVEPSGAAGMTRALEAGRVVALERIESRVQGLTPPGAGHLNLAVVERCGTTVRHLDDDVILRAQARLVREGGWTLEPAGAAAAALVLEGGGVRGRARGLRSRAAPGGRRGAHGRQPRRGADREPAPMTGGFARRAAVLVLCMALGACERRSATPLRPPVVVLLQLEGADGSPSAASPWAPRLEGSGAARRVVFESRDRSAAGTLATILSGADARVHGLLSARDLGAHQAADGVASVAEAFGSAGWDVRGRSGLGWLSEDHSGPRRGFDAWAAAEGHEAPERTLAQLGDGLRSRPTLLCGVLALPAFEGRTAPGAAAAELSQLGAFGDSADLGARARAGEAGAWEALVEQFARRRGSAGHVELKAAVARVDRAALRAALDAAVSELAGTHRVLGIALVERLERGAGRGMLVSVQSDERLAPPHEPRALARWACELAGVAWTPTPPGPADWDVQDLCGLVLDCPAGSGRFALRLRVQEPVLSGGRIAALEAGVEVDVRALEAERGVELRVEIDARSAARRVTVDSSVRAVDWGLEWTVLEPGPGARAAGPIVRDPEGRPRVLLYEVAASPWALAPAGAEGLRIELDGEGAVLRWEGDPPSDGPQVALARRQRSDWSFESFELAPGTSLPVVTRQGLLIAASGVPRLAGSWLVPPTFKMRLIPGGAERLPTDYVHESLVPELRRRGPNLPRLEAAGDQLRARVEALHPSE